jgi:hypothetical protein
MTMSALTASPHDLMRRCVAAMDESHVLEIIDSMNLTGVKLPAVVAVPLRNLQKKRDVSTFAAGSPIDAISSLLELLSMDPLEKIIELLGDHAENPNYEQLKASVDELRTLGGTRNDLLAVLGFAAGQEFPAAPACRQILDEEADLDLPELTITVGTTSLLSLKEQDAAVLEQRKARREEEKARKKAQAEKAKAGKVKHEKKAKAAPAPAPVTTPAPVAPVLAVTRRSVMLTPAELAQFDPAHALAGWVVFTEVPFDAVDPMAPELQSKHRPAVVLAAGDAGLLVRGIYSHDAPSRTLFQPWRRASLDHISYVDDRRIEVSAEADVTKLVKLTDEEWNALF